MKKSVAVDQIGTGMQKTAELVSLNCTIDIITVFSVNISAYIPLRAAALALVSLMLWVAIMVELDWFIHGPFFHYLCCYYLNQEFVGGCSEFREELIQG